MLRHENKYFITDQPPKSCCARIKIALNATIKNIIRYKLLQLIHPEIDDSLFRYKVSICAIFKNEAVYLREWIEFHKIVGIEHFYLYNNNSTDNYMDVLSPYIEKGLVELEDFSKNQAQLECYTKCINDHKKESVWIGFIDIDEFIVPNTTDTVYDFLKDFNRRPAVIVYWKMFCSSGIVKRNLSGLITKDFTVCFPKYYTVGKIFFNTSYDFIPSHKWNRWFHHYMWSSYHNVLLPPVNVFDKICTFGRNPIPHCIGNNDFPLQINHYFSKSLNEYNEKCKKGDVYYEKNPHDYNYLLMHEYFCTSVDYHIYKYLAKLELQMEEVDV